MTAMGRLPKSCFNIVDWQSMSGMAARCPVSRLNECLLVISEQAASLLMVKMTPSIGEVQRTSGISESNSMTLRRYYRYRPEAVITQSPAKQTFRVLVCFRISDATSGQKRHCNCFFKPDIYSRINARTTPHEPHFSHSIRR